MSVAIFDAKDLQNISSLCDTDVIMSSYGLKKHTHICMCVCVSE